MPCLYRHNTPRRPKEKSHRLPPMRKRRRAPSDAADETASDTRLPLEPHRIDDERAAVTRLPLDRSMSSPNQESRRRKKRGPTLLGKKETYDPSARIEFNDLNQPVGDQQSKFASYIGYKTRSMIPIIHPTWKKVKKEEKERLWLTIKNFWNIEDDKRKDDVLKQCNASWKAFKRQLRSTLLDKKENPLDKYHFISKDDWEKFVQMSSTKKVMEQRVKGREWAKKNISPARLGPKGYRGNIPKWEEERKDSRTSTVIHKMENDRARHFMLGRRVKDIDGQWKLPNQLQSIADDLVKTDKQVSEGTLQPEAGSDPLTLVIGPEHPGRTRGVGHMIGLKKGIPRMSEKKRKSCNKEDLSHEISKQIKLAKEEIRDEMQAEFDRKLELAMERVASRHGGLLVPSPGLRKSSVGSTLDMGDDVDDDMDKIEEPTSCVLYLPYGQKKVECAKGMVYPRGNGQVHNVPLYYGHVKVQVDFVDQRYKDLPLPVTTQELQWLQDAANTFIQWPRHALAFSQLSKDVDTSVPTQHVSVPTAGTSIKGKDVDQIKRNKMLSHMLEKEQIILQKPQFIKVVYNKVMKREEPTSSFHSEIEPGVFDKEGCVYTLEPVDIVDMMAGECVDMSIIIWFAKSTHLIVEPSGNKCAFFNPETIREQECVEHGENVVRHLTRAMEFHNKKSIFLAPYFQGNHWVLFIIAPQEGKWFILDSSKTGKKAASYTLTKHLEKAIKIYLKNKKRVSIKWTFPNCNQQSDGYECGYYIMRWMHEFLFSSQHVFPARIPWNDTSPFSGTQLEEIVGTSLGLFMKFFCD